MTRAKITAILSALGMFCALVGLPGTAAARVERYAVIVGANYGDVDDVPLRFAEADAERMSSILQTHGGLDADHVILLNRAEANDIRAALERLERRLDEQGRGDSLVLFFFSGHADAAELHLNGTRLGLAELRERLAHSSATVRVLVLDACRSGAITRLKGGRPGPSFKIDLEDRLRSRGLAILTSSAAGEDSQESDELGSSFFTHYLSTGLIGAADADGDGRVTLNEAFSYASERTLSATTTTMAGPQHPTYQLNMGGRRELVLTRPALANGDVGAAVFTEPGAYTVYAEENPGRVMAEVTIDGRHQMLFIPAGRYMIVRRNAGRIQEGAFEIPTANAVAVSSAEMRSVEHVSHGIKGPTLFDEVADTPEQRPWSLFVQAGLRGEILDLGISTRVAAGADFRLVPFTLEARIAYGTSEAESAGAPLRTHELGGILSVARPFELGLVTLAPALELGWHWYAQRFAADRADRDASLVSAGLALRARFDVSEDLYLRLDGGAVAYLVETGANGGDVRLEVPVTYRVMAGLGW